MYTHTYTHTSRTHTHIHTQVHTHTYTHTHTHTHTHSRTLTHIHPLSQQALLNVRARVLKREVSKAIQREMGRLLYTHTHTHTQTGVHAPTHTHTGTCTHLTVTFHRVDSSLFAAFFHKLGRSAFQNMMESTHTPRPPPTQTDTHMHTLSCKQLEQLLKRKLSTSDSERGCYLHLTGTVSVQHNRVDETLRVGWEVERLEMGLKELGAGVRIGR